MKSTYDSVQEQTGLFAGNGGFDVTVGRHTQLDGAVIASTASADKNSLDTGTLGFSDLHNEADFKTQHAGGSFNSGGQYRRAVCQQCGKYAAGRRWQQRTRRGNDSGGNR